jgi:hypothetical protein
VTAPVITVEDMEKIYPIPDGIDPTVFIAQATLMVSEFPFEYSQERINAIGLYLACHLVFCYEPQSTSYEGMKISDKGFDAFLRGSPYGQNACLLDMDGYMYSWGRPKARLYSLCD